MLTSGSRLAGRIDRKIEFPLPDEKTKRRIFNIHTSRMTLSDDVDLEELIMAKDDLSGADIKVNTTLHAAFWVNTKAPFVMMLS
jgi:ATP-dependent 26S proteasome regulatory subunit